MTQGPVRVLGYARVSTEDQARGDYSSVEAQSDWISRHCAYLSQTTGREHSLVDVIRDEGFSGKDTNRPGLKELERRVEARQVSLICVYKLDRITRSLLDFLHLDAVFETYGVGLISIREQFDTSTPLGRAMRAILLVFAQLERETTVQRVMDKFTAMVESGVWPGGGRPYGYRRLGPHTLEIDPDEAAVVRRIFDMYDHGESSLGIARQLKDDGVPRRGGGHWDPGRVTKILRDPCHQGVLALAGRTGVWPFPRIVDPEIAARVAIRIGAHAAHRGPNRVSHDWYRLVRCGSCGGTMTWRRKRSCGKYLYYLSCRNGEWSKGAYCDQRSLRTEMLETMTRRILDATVKSQPPPAPIVAPDHAEEIAQLRAERERTVIAWIRGQLDTSVHDRMVAEYDREIERLTPAAPLPTWETAVNLSAAWDGLNMAQRNAALLKLVDRAEVFPERIVIFLVDTGWIGWPETIVIRRPGHLHWPAGFAPIE